MPGLCQCLLSMPSVLLNILQSPKAQKVIFRNQLCLALVGLEWCGPKSRTLVQLRNHQWLLTVVSCPSRKWLLRTTLDWKQAKTSHAKLWDLYMKMKWRSEMLLLHQEKLFVLCDRTSVMSFCDASQCMQLVRCYSNSGWGRGLNWGGWQMGSELQICYSARNPVPKGGLFFDCVDPTCHLVFPLHPGEDKSDRIMWSYGLELWKAPVPDSFTLVRAEDWAVCSLSKLCS